MASSHSIAYTINVDKGSVDNYIQPLYSNPERISFIFSDIVYLAENISTWDNTIDISERDRELNIHFHKAGFVLLVDLKILDESPAYNFDLIDKRPDTPAIFASYNTWDYGGFIKTLIQSLEKAGLCVYAKQQNPEKYESIPHLWDTEPNSHYLVYGTLIEAVQQVGEAVEAAAKSLVEAFECFGATLVDTAESYSNALASVAVLGRDLENYPYSLRGLKEDD